MFKKIALLLGLMTSMLFSVSALAAVNAADTGQNVAQHEVEQPFHRGQQNHRGRGFKARPDATAK